MKNMESVTWGQGLSIQAPTPACISPALLLLLLLLLLCCHWCPHIDVKEDVGQKGWRVSGAFFQLGKKFLYSTCKTIATLQRLTGALQTHLASVSLQFSDGTSGSCHVISWKKKKKSCFYQFTKKFFATFFFEDWSWIKLPPRLWDFNQ